jgi:hypothetical protein
MFCETDLLTADPADDTESYPPIAAWEPLRQTPRRRIAAKVRPQRAVLKQAHGVSLEYPTLQSEIPEFRGAETTNLVAQSAFLKASTSEQVVTQCTIAPRVQILGASMQKPDFFSARTYSNATSLPGLSTTGFVGASPVHRPEGPGFQHSVPSLLNAERLNGFGARWLQSLPVSVRPLITAKRHPHIVNKFAILWGEDEAVDAYFDELLISARPGRRGFATEVLDELVDLQRAVQEQRRY